MRIKAKIFLLVVCGLVVSCSPQAGHKVLSFFFDGVPGDKSKSGVSADAPAKHNGSNVHSTFVSTKAATKYYYHPPFFDKECTKCHNNSTSSTLAAPMPGLCYSCHKDFKTKFNYVHGPVAGGFCNVCHSPHRSENQHMLKREGQAMCIYCHSKEQVLTVKAHTGIGDTECTKCHDPHGGTNRYVLKQ